VLKGPSTEEIELTLIENPWLRVPGAYPAELTYLMFLRADQDEIGLCERILMLEGQTAEWYTQHRR
jgi:hypothetical protein